MQVIFIPRTVVTDEKCPNCGAPSRAFQAMKCPTCNAGFCGHCFVAIPEENGNTLRCPQCRTKLEFPDTPQIRHQPAPKN